MVGSGILKWKSLAKFSDVGLDTQRWTQIIQNHISEGVEFTNVMLCRYSVKKLAQRTEDLVFGNAHEGKREN